MKTVDCAVILPWTAVQTWIISKRGPSPRMARTRTNWLGPPNPVGPLVCTLISRGGDSNSISPRSQSRRIGSEKNLFFLLLDNKNALDEQLIWNMKWKLWIWLNFVSVCFVLRFSFQLSVQWRRGAHKMWTWMFDCNQWWLARVRGDAFPNNSSSILPPREQTTARKAMLQSTEHLVWRGQAKSLAVWNSAHWPLGARSWIENEKFNFERQQNQIQNEEEIKLSLQGGLPIGNKTFRSVHWYRSGGKVYYRNGHSMSRIETQSNELHDFTIKFWTARGGDKVKMN